jgi:hypothetical protein
MAQFTSKQKAVMDQLLQQEQAAKDLANDEEEEEEMDTDEAMECVICNQASSIAMERPIGLVTLAMATSGKYDFNRVSSRMFHKI